MNPLCHLYYPITSFQRQSGLQRGQLAVVALLYLLEGYSEPDATASLADLGQLALQSLPFLQQPIRQLLLLLQANTASRRLVDLQPALNLGYFEVIGLNVESLRADIAPAHLLHLRNHSLIELIQRLIVLLLVITLLQVALLQLLRLLLHLQFPLKLVLEGIAQRPTQQVHDLLGVSLRGDVFLHQFGLYLFVHDFEVLYPEDDQGPEQCQYCAGPDEVVEIDVEVVEVHVDADHDDACDCHDLEVDQSRFDCLERVALVLALFLEPALLVLGIVDGVEYLRELALVGLPAEDEEEEDREDGDSRLKVLPAGQFVELALDFEQEVGLFPHLQVMIMIRLMLLK